LKARCSGRLVSRWPSGETYALHQFLEEIVLPRREPVVVAVFKRVWINGAGLHFVAIGSPTR
jgi:hypothetical protein